MTAAEQLQQEIEKHGGSRFKWYNEIYLLSDHWKKLKARKYKQVGRKCEKCDTTKKLQVHHLEYRSVFDVQLGDLQVLCDDHHKEAHGLSHKPAQKKSKGGKKKRKKGKPTPPDPSGPKPLTSLPPEITQRFRDLCKATPRSDQQCIKNHLWNTLRKELHREGVLTDRLSLLIRACKGGKNGKQARHLLRQETELENKIDRAVECHHQLDEAFNSTPC